MTLSLFMSARMGIYQESLSLEYGKNPREALFYSVIIQSAFLNGNKYLITFIPACFTTAWFLNTWKGHI